MAEKILDLFDRPVDRRIEEVIKVDQTQAAVVREEIEEYVPTEPIRRNFLKILSAFRDTPNHPHEGIGIWISGFFGAGKSLFAKILGYVLENRELNGVHAAELFGRQTTDTRIQALLQTINTQIPSRAIIFDVSTDQAVTDASEKLTDVLYRVMLRELGYSTDREIAELEIELEGEDRLAAFKAIVEGQRGKAWDAIKNLPASARNVASRALHELDPDTYPQPDTWAHTPLRVDVTASWVAERAFELSRRRADGRALVFVVDEVGQYVARSTDKMLDLQGLVQALGREGRNRSGTWKGQVWLVVTSQERLSEVVDNLEGVTVELSRLRDRFPIEVDLAPSDIREVTAQRVLKKKPSETAGLEALFEAHSGRLREATRLAGRLEGPPLDAASFTELYPFLPYQIDLLIEVVSGLRRQAGASRHVGGANRTIIKLAQQVLINSETRLGEAPVGQLVSLDLIYELLKNLVSTERKRDVAEIEEHFGRAGIETRVARALALLQFVEAFARSPENIAAVLHPSVEANPLRQEVAEAIESLKRVGKVRWTENGWELLSGVGRSWEEERRGIDVMPRTRAALLQEAAATLFRDLPGYRHQNLKTFTAIPTLNGQRVGRARGDVDLLIDVVMEPGTLESTRERGRTASNADQGRNSLHWVVLCTEELLQELDDQARCREMVRRYAARQVAGEQATLFADEKARERQIEARVASLFGAIFPTGHAYFRGVHTPIREHGDDLLSAVRGCLADAVPRLYPHFDLAAAPVREDAARRILDSDSLAGLPAVYYEGSDGLGLVRRAGGEYRIDTSHGALAAVLDFIRERKQYGEDASGRALESRFTGFDYGWDLEMVMLLAATLFRGAEVEVYSGRRYTSYAEPAVRDVFRRTNAFRAATFTPRTEDTPTLPILTKCAQTLQQLYGEQVRIEEGAIAAALQRKLPEEGTRAHRVANILRANHLPGADVAESLATELFEVTGESPRNTVLAFHAQAETLGDGIRRMRRLESALSGDNLQTLVDARATLDRRWPQLQELGLGEELREDAESLEEALATESFPGHLPAIGQRAATIRAAYQEHHSRLAEELRTETARRADDIRNRPEWTAVPETVQAAILAPLNRIGEKATADRAGLPELHSDLLSLDRLHGDAVAELIRQHDALTREGDGPAPPPTVRRIRTGRFASRGLHNRGEVDRAVDALREECYQAVDRNETVILE